MTAHVLSEGTPLARTTAVTHGTFISTETINYAPSARCSVNAGDSTMQLTGGSIEEMHGSWLEGCLPAGALGSTVLGLLTASVTPSMLAIPYAMALAGTRFGMMCIFVCLMLTVNSVRILALASTRAASDDYEVLADYFFGHRAMWFTCGTLLLCNFGAGVVYLRFILDSLEPLLKAINPYTPPWLHERQGAVVALCMFVGVVTPWSFKSRLASLRTKGFIANAFVAFIVACIVYRYVHPVQQVSVVNSSPELRINYLPLVFHPFINYLVAGPIYVFAYELQSNALTVFRDLEHPSPSRVLIVVSLTLLGATLFYVPLGIFGSWSFGSQTSGNILENYDAGTDPLMFTSQVCCCFAAGMSFIFALFPCRISIFMLLTTQSATSVHIPHSLRIRIGVALSLLCCICAVFVPNGAITLSFLGACCSVTLSMTLPALFAIKMRQSGACLTSFFDGLLMYGMLLFGVFLSVSGTLTTLLVENVG